MISVNEVNPGSFKSKHLELEYVLSIPWNPSIAHLATLSQHDIFRYLSPDIIPSHDCTGPAFNCFTVSVPIKYTTQAIATTIANIIKLVLQQ